MKFELKKTLSGSKARLGEITTTHGKIATPVFMPVGTQGTVKTLDFSELLEARINIILANAYHLYLRPGPEIIRLAGGLHRFSGWDGAILTDSGGYQIFSLAQRRKISPQGVEFSSHIDGKKIFLTPEDIVNWQLLLGSDIMMPLDECLGYPVGKEYARSSLNLTRDWAERSKLVYEEKLRQQPDCPSVLFGIVQGAQFPDLRQEAAHQLVELDFAGYAIGGLSVGEPRQITWECLEAVTEILPEDRPRYFMGLGEPGDILEAVDRGVDMFDCVLPTRNGRNGQAFTRQGKLNIKNAGYKSDFQPIEKNCPCPVCRKYSRAYINHLFNSGELLALRLLSLHNLYFMRQLLEDIRRAIAAGDWPRFKADFLNGEKEYAANNC